MSASGRFVGIGIVAFGLVTACGAVSRPGLPPGLDAGGPPPGGNGGAGEDANPTGGGGGPPPAGGLVLRRAGLVEGLDGSDWQCAGGLCLRGRITP